MNWLFALLSAALLICVFPGFNAVWLAPVALTPLLLVAAREQRTWRRFALGYAGGLVYWFVTCNWIQWTIQTHGGMSGATAWFVFVLFSLAKALQMGVFTLLAGWTLRTRLAVPATAASWVLIEYTHAPLGFAWLQLGNAGIDMSLPMRIAPIAGVWGLSFFFALIAAEIANFVLKRPGIPGLAVVAIGVLFLLPPIPEKALGDQHALLVQPNIDEEATWTPQSFARLLQRMRELSSTSSQPVQQLVWPEAPAPFYANDPDFMTYLKALAHDRHVAFLAGLVAHTPQGGNLNSAVMIDSEGKLLTRYDKINLVPFGEFIPWPLGPIAFQISNEAGGFLPGNRQVVTKVGNHSVSTFICYESVFPNFIRTFVKNGAEVLFNPSNDGWFGKTPARYQHLEIVRMRAAENQRWILRATNDGITAAIDPAGRVSQTFPLYSEGAAVMAYSYRKDMTFYTRHGDWLVLVCLALAGYGIYSGTSTWVRISSKMRSPASARREPSALLG